MGNPRGGRIFLVFRSHNVGIRFNFGTQRGDVTGDMDERLRIYSLQPLPSCLTERFGINIGFYDAFIGPELQNKSLWPF
jgi:hypothetical protein